MKPPIMLDVLKELIPSIRRSPNNHQVYLAGVCLFCEGKTGNKGRILRYNMKLKILKCFNCGMAFKEVGQLLKALEEVNRYEKWLKDNVSVNRKVLSIERKRNEAYEDLPF